MKRLSSIAVAALLCMSLAPAWAADDHDHDHASKHGGIVVEAGHHHLEVVASDGALELHVVGEDGAPESVEGATATAAVLSQGTKTDVSLAPAGAATLKGSGAFKAGKGTVIVITLKMPDHEPEQVRLKLD